jgi:hypothetical protein
VLRVGDVECHLIAARAMAYGLARMYIDGQFPSWGLNEKTAMTERIAILDQFFTSMQA